MLIYIFTHFYIQCYKYLEHNQDIIKVLQHNMFIKHTHVIAIRTSAYFKLLMATLHGKTCPNMRQASKRWSTSANWINFLFAKKVATIQPSLGNSCTGYTLYKKICLKVWISKAWWSLLLTTFRNQFRQSSEHCGSIARQFHKASTWSIVNSVINLLSNRLSLPQLSLVNSTPGSQHSICIWTKHCHSSFRAKSLYCYEVSLNNTQLLTRIPSSDEKLPNLIDNLVSYNYIAGKQHIENVPVTYRYPTSCKLSTHDTTVTQTVK